MRVFLDANVRVSVLNREYPHFPYSARVLSLADQSHFQLFTTPICLAIAFYFAEKKCGAAAAKKKMSVLSNKIHISLVEEEAVSEALKNTQVIDFEDGLEYYAALNSQCKVIVSEDRDSFYFSEIPVYDCHKFLEELVFKRN